MNRFGWFFTHSTFTLGSPSCFGPCFVPSATTGISCTSRPSRMILFFNIFRLPFCHAIIITKEFITVKIRCWACYRLTAVMTFFNNTVRPAWVRFSNLPDLSTLKGTIDLITLSSANRWLSANGAEIRRLLFSPSVFEVTITRTKGLIWSSVLWVKFFTAIVTNSKFFMFSHTYIINYIAIKVKIEEKYCAIAVKRLGQGVLAL